MEQNIIVAGVGGQGILSVAYVLCNAALEEGLNFKQSEVHGMAQRGGAVQSNLRISSQPVQSDLIAQGTCDLILAVEPLEVLRYTQFLHPKGAVVTSMNPFINIPNYPNFEAIWTEMEKVRHFIPIQAEALAKKAGSSLAQGTVILGAASNILKLRVETLETWVRKLWEPKGERIQTINLEAFRLGRRMSAFLQAVAEAGADRAALRALAESVPLPSAEPSRAQEWVSILKKTPSRNWPATISGQV